jgi:mono/diheme cytochrome c family protein
MNKAEQQAYLESYKEEKKHGIPFFPDAIFKDAVVTLLIFAALMALAYFLGAPLEERANPSDTSYTPKPEWYFLFLFQLLKYFPGQLEVVGVVLLPTLAILLLAALPFIDRSAKRHPLNRLGVISGTALLVAVVGVLTYMAIVEAPPPAETRTGDPTAALYAANCAPCHGQSIAVPSAVNLHDVIAQGNHEGMPAWGADLTTDQIDALAGFILSPRGGELFSCSAASARAAGASLRQPGEIKRALDQAGYAARQSGRAALERDHDLGRNDGPDELPGRARRQRLWGINCASCHGNAVAFSGTEGGARDHRRGRPAPRHAGLARQAQRGRSGDAGAVRRRPGQRAGRRRVVRAKLLGLPRRARALVP